VVLVLEALGQFSTFDFISPYFFTSHFQDWFNLLRQPIPWHSIRDAMIVFAVTIVALTAAGWAVFQRRDILS
jgi:ABC-type transport system involved in multi-copper enzyme maturation permease subunit